MTGTIVGMDVRLDENRRLRAWRVVVANDAVPRDATEFLVRLPDDVDYFTPPLHPLHGHLFDLPLGIDQQADAIAVDIRDRGGDAASIAAHHIGWDMHSALVARGIAFTPVEVEMPEPGSMDDPFSIGGEAGHEIANIARKGNDR